MAHWILGLEVRQKEVSFELGETQITEELAIELCKQDIFGLFFFLEKMRSKILVLSWSGIRLHFLNPQNPTLVNAQGIVFLFLIEDGIYRLERDRCIEG